MKYIALLLLTIFNFSFGQKLIILDDETDELLVNVECVLYKNGKNIDTFFTLEKEPNFIKSEIKFDSIVFKKTGYYKKTVFKLDAEVAVFLNKETLIEEIFVSTNKKDTLLGEKNKFNKRCFLPLNNYVSHLLKVNNPYNKVVDINSFKFYLDKIYYKTNYVLKFYDLKLTDNILDYSDSIQEIFTSKPMYLTMGDNKEVSVDLTEYHLKLEPNQNIFVSIELINYFDENNTVVEPELYKRTIYKTIYSKKTNYYSKGFITTESRLTDYYNINARLLFGQINAKLKFSKSSFLAPAFYLEIEKPY